MARRPLANESRIATTPDEGGRGWVPPPWHGPPANVPDAPAQPASRTTQPATTRRASSDARRSRRIVLGLAAVPATTGAAALAFAFIPVLSGSGALPLGLLSIVAIQVIGYVFSRREEANPLSHAWLAGIVQVVGLLPLLALQQALLREPYVALSRGSAAPAIAATAVVALLLAVVAAWCAVSFWPAPEEASLVFLPAALLVPGVIGAPGSLGQRTALEALAEASLLAAGATAIGWSVPRGARPLLPPAALGVQFIALWLAGRGPSVPTTSGGIVPVLYAVLLVVTVVLTVGVPLVSLWIRRLVLSADRARFKAPRRPEPDLSPVQPPRARRSNRPVA
ncbi:MAG TPA: hypothetical protein VIL01_14585 [Thermomicrobiales bacterium]